MTSKNASEAKQNVEQANDEFGRAGNDLKQRLGKWLEWRASKLQSVRQEVVEKTRLTGKPGFGNRARVASRG
jgi:hypothetical protein